MSLQYWEFRQGLITRQFSREEEMAIGRIISGTLLALGCWLCLAVFGARSETVPDREDLKLETRDGVSLAATYYPSIAGKEAVPIVMLHDFKETRNVFGNMAIALQDSNSGGASHAVITVDLRGHGESTVQSDRFGRTRELEASRLRPADYQLMVTQDMEAVRRFLVEKNDAGELNLNSLTIIGSGMGANVGIYWAAADWNTPTLATRKQGQDVKALVVSSPEWSFKGLPLVRPLRSPGLQREVSFLITYGEQFSKAKKDANNLIKNLKKYRPDPPPDKVAEWKNLFDVPLPMKLQGTKLLISSETNMLPDIKKFVEVRVEKQDFPWLKRK